jgi:hypothetical protein
MKANNAITFNLDGIKTEQFAILEENYSDKKKSVDFGTGIQFMIDSESKFVGSVVRISFDQGKKSFLKIDVSCHFKIEDDSWNTFINKKQQTLTIPKGFLAHMAMITVGTLRGILFAKTEGTIFNKFIIPTIDVASMIEKDETFSLKEDE